MKYVIEIETLLKKYIWDGKRAKLTLDLIKSSKSDGGLAMINLAIKDMSLKIQWVLTVLNYEVITHITYTFLGCKGLGNNIWKCNLSSVDVLSVFKLGFSADVLYSWAWYNYYALQPHQIPYQILWYNSHMLVKNKSVCYDSAVQKGVMYLYDIIQDGGLMSYQQFCDRWGRCLTWLQYYSVIDTLPILWKQIIQSQNVIMDTCAIMYKMTGFLQPPRYLSKVYKKSNSYKYAVLHKLCKWEFIFDKVILLNVFSEVYR